MQKKPRFSTRHQCDLTKRDRGDVDVFSPYDRSLRKCWHHVQNSMTIGESKYASYYFRSNASFRREKLRHLTTKKYRCIIHPLSSFARLKSIVLLYCWLVVYTVEPVLGTFYSALYFDRDLFDLTAVAALLAIVYTVLGLDVLFRFFTGYIVKKNGEVVLEPGSIAKRYLKFYFWVDFIPYLAAILTWFLQSVERKNMIIIFYSLRSIRFLRVHTMLKYFNNFLLMCRCGTTVRNLITLIVIGFFCIHWWTCFLALLYTICENWNIPNDNSWVRLVAELRNEGSTVVKKFEDLSEWEAFEKYIDFLQIVVSHFFGAGVTKFKTADEIERLFFSGILLSGLIYNILVLARVLQVFGTVNISETRFEDRITQLNKYFRKHEVPSKLRKRVFTYYDVKFNQKFFSENEIFSTLSEHLRMEVVLYSCEYLIERVQIFKGLSKAAIGSVLALMEQHIYLPGDVIISSDSDSDRGILYFILYGTCMVCTKMSQREACHIEDGNHFGEIAAFTKDNELRVLYQVVALEPVEVYCLKEKDLDFCCTQNPEIFGRLDAMKKNRLQMYKDLMAVTTNRFVIHEEDIMSELRAEHILHHGIRRDAFGINKLI